MGRLDVENKSSNCDDIPWQVMKWGNVFCEMNVRLFACEIIACCGECSGGSGGDHLTVHNYDSPNEFRVSHQRVFRDVIGLAEVSVFSRNLYAVFYYI